MPLAGTQISVIRLWLLLAGGQGQSLRTRVRAMFSACTHALMHTPCTLVHWMPMQRFPLLLPCHVCPYNLYNYPTTPLKPPPFIILCCVLPGLSKGPGFAGSVYHWIVWRRGAGNYNCGGNKQDRAKWDLATVTWELFIHYWSNGKLCFFCFRIFCWGVQTPNIWSNCWFISGQ